jgi:hypothetical protein
MNPKRQIQDQTEFVAPKVTTEVTLNGQTRPVGRQSVDITLALIPKNAREAYRIALRDYGRGTVGVDLRVVETVGDKITETFKGIPFKNPEQLRDIIAGLERAKAILQARAEG